MHPFSLFYKARKSRRNGERAERMRPGAGETVRRGSALFLVAPPRPCGRKDKPCACKQEQQQI